MVDLNFFLGALGDFVIYIIQWIILIASWVVFSIAPIFVIVYLGLLMIFGGGLLEDIKSLDRGFLAMIGSLIVAVVFYIVSFSLLGTQGTLIGGVIGAVLASLLVWRLSKSN